MTLQQHTDAAADVRSGFCVEKHFYSYSCKKLKGLSQTVAFGKIRE